MTATPSRGFLPFVERWFDPLHQHVRLVYPYADTNRTLTSVFSDRGATSTPGAAPSDQAWLFGLARKHVYSTEDDASAFRRRNAAAVAMGLRDATVGLTADVLAVAERTVDGFASLPVEMQEILRLHTAESLSPVEIAWILAVDESIAAALFDDAIQELKLVIDHESSGSDQEARDA